jgi:hypothetical protein
MQEGPAPFAAASRRVSHISDGEMKGLMKSAVNASLKRSLQF